jgi:hypothetical protein
VTRITSSALVLSSGASFSLPQLTTLDGRLEVASSAMTNVSLPLLASIGGSLIIESAPEVTNLNLDSLTNTSGTVTIVGTKLNTISFPELTRAASFTLENNGLLQNISLPMWQGEEGAFIFVQNNAMLASVTLLAYVGKGFTRITGNNVLEELALPKLEGMNFSFNIAGTALRRIDLPLMRYVQNSATVTTTVLPNLEYFNAPLLESVGDNFQLILPKLNFTDLSNLKNVGSQFTVQDTLLTKLELPQLRAVGSLFSIFRNNELQNVSIPTWSGSSSDFPSISSNSKLTLLSMDSLFLVGSISLRDNSPNLVANFPKFCVTIHSFRPVNVKAVTTCSNVTTGSCFSGTLEFGNTTFFTANNCSCGVCPTTTTAGPTTTTLPTSTSAAPNTTTTTTSTLATSTTSTTATSTLSSTSSSAAATTTGGGNGTTAAATTTMGGGTTFFSTSAAAGATAITVTMILDFTPTSAQLDSMIQIFASLTGFPASSISMAITAQRDSTVQSRLTGANAGAAGNLIYTTLTTNPNYLTSQDSSLGGVRSVALQDTSSSGGLSTGAIVGIAIGATVAVALIVVLVVLLIRRRQFGTNKGHFYGSSTSADYGMETTGQQQPNAYYQ